MAKKEPELKVEIEENLKGEHPVLEKNELMLIITKGENFLRLIMRPQGKDLYLRDFQGNKALYFFKRAKAEVEKIMERKGLERVTVDVVKSPRLIKLAERMGFKTSRVRRSLDLPYGHMGYRGRGMTPMSQRRKRK
jgi:hypothetical protein